MSVLAPPSTSSSWTVFYTCVWVCVCKREREKECVCVCQTLAKWTKIYVALGKLPEIWRSRTSGVQRLDNFLVRICACSRVSVQIACVCVCVPLCVCVCLCCSGNVSCSCRYVCLVRMGNDLVSCNQRINQLVNVITSGAIALSSYTIAIVSPAS